MQAPSETKHIKESTKLICDNQIKIYSHFGPGIKPRSIKRESETSISYTWVDGEACYDIARIIEATQEHVWEKDKRRKKVCDRDGYIAYMHKRCADHFTDLNDEGIPIGKAFGIFERLEHVQLTEVFTSHGDLTLQNTVLTPSGALILIDPMDDHKMRCREMEEAKLLTSIDGWEIHARGWMKPIKNIDAIRVTEAHEILLLSHYIRAIKYQTGVVRDFIYKRTYELIEKLSKRG